jgi:hypothetical protein
MRYDTPFDGLASSLGMAFSSAHPAAHSAANDIIQAEIPFRMLWSVSGSVPGGKIGRRAFGITVTLYLIGCHLFQPQHSLKSVSYFGMKVLVDAVFIVLDAHGVQVLL